jgi:mono/diheme cytochrome c family protein
VTLFAKVDSRLITALTVLGGLAIFAVLLIATAAGELRGRRKAKVPVGFRPAPSDEELESRVLVRYLAWGSVALVFIALWIPAYWLREPTRIASKKAKISADTVKEGKELYESLCMTCHGEHAEGGTRQYPIGGVKRNYAEPPLRYIYSRYVAAGRNKEDITQILYDAINRGRPPATPMPTWGLAFGGPLNSRQVDALVAFLQDIQEDFPKPDTLVGKTLFEANCAICHGPKGEGGVGPNLTVALERINKDQLMQTIHDGRLNVNRPSMPSWAALGDAAIDALVEYIESIQRSS